MFMYSLLKEDQSVSHIRLSEVMRLRVDSSLAVFSSFLLVFQFNH